MAFSDGTPLATIHSVTHSPFVIRVYLSILELHPLSYTFRGGSVALDARGSVGLQSFAGGTGVWFDGGDVLIEARQNHKAATHETEGNLCHSAQRISN